MIVEVSRYLWYKMVGVQVQYAWESYKVYWEVQDRVNNPHEDPNPWKWDGELSWTEGTEH